MSVHIMPEEPQPMPTRCPKHNLIYEGTCYMCKIEDAQKKTQHNPQAKPGEAGHKRQIG